MTGRDTELFNQARLVIEAGDLAKAIDLLQESCDVVDHFKSRELLGDCYARLGNDAEALLQYRRAFELNPRSCRTGMMLAECLVRIGRGQRELVEVLRDVLAVNPTYGPAKRLLTILGSDG